MQVPAGTEWLAELGVSRDQLAELNPCVPGEFTLPDAYYINIGSPGTIYAGTEEGTLPLVAGRWYSLSSDTIHRHSELTRDAAPVARAVRLVG